MKLPLETFQKKNWKQMKDGSKLFQTYLYILHVMRFAHFLQSTDCGTLAFLSPLWDLALSVRPAKRVQMTRGSD